MPTHNSQKSFKIRRFFLEKLARRSSHDTIKTSIWVSRCLRRPLRLPTLTRNAPLPAMSPSEGGLCLAWWPRWRWRGPLVIQQDCRHHVWKHSYSEKHHKMSYTCPPALQMPRSGTSSQWTSASPWVRPHTSPFSRSPSPLAPRNNLEVLRLDACQCQIKQSYFPHSSVNQSINQSITSTQIEW